MQYFKLYFATLIAVLSVQSVVFCEEELKTRPADVSNRYQTAVLSRPWTMPANSFQTGLKFKTGSHGSGESAFYSLDTLSIDYGVTNDFEIGLSWGGLKMDTIAFDNLKANPSVSLNFGYYLFSIPHLSTMATFSLPFHFDKEVVKTSSFAMPASISIINGKLAFLAFYYDSIVMHWRDNGKTGNDKVDAYTLDFNFPLKLNYQATSSFITSIETLLGTVSSNGKYSHIGQATPLYLNGTYAITNAFDVVAKAGFSDVQDWKNSFSFVAGIDYRFGAIDG